MTDPKYTQQPAPYVERINPYPPSSKGQDPSAPRTADTDRGFANEYTIQPPPGEDSGSEGYSYATNPEAGVKPAGVPGEDYTPPPGERQGKEEGEKGNWGFGQRMHELGTKAAEPINAMANKVGSQAFLPSTMDKECDKAANILLSFCEDGAQSQTPTRSRALLKIPPSVLKNAAGLAIFTAARAGLQFSASTGSGILIARRDDGSWGAPSGIQVHTLGAGFSAGADIYDCVCVINSREGVGQFARGRVSLGGEMAVVGGPVGVGGVVDVGAGRSEKSEETQVPAGTGEKTATGEKQGHAAADYGPFDPVFTYVKSRGLFAGIQVDGTVITERREANAAFYGERVSASQIIHGDGGLPARQAPHLWPVAAKSLYDALKRAESRSEEGEKVVPQARGGAVENEGVGKGEGEGQGQGGQDPVPRQGKEELGRPSGSSVHRTTDELPGYEGTGDSIRGQKAPEIGQGMPGEVPRQEREKKGTAGGEGAHTTSDELPSYPGGGKY